MLYILYGALGRQKVFKFCAPHVAVLAGRDFLLRSVHPMSFTKQMKEQIKVS